MVLNRMSGLALQCNWVNFEFRRDTVSRNRTFGALMVKRTKRTPARLMDICINVGVLYVLVFGRSLATRIVMITFIVDLMFGTC